MEQMQFMDSGAPGVTDPEMVLFHFQDLRTRLFMTVGLPSE